MKSDEALEHIKYLKEITNKTRLVAAYHYPYFILWGIIVAIGYLGSYIFSTHLVWLVTIIGAIITKFISFYHKHKTHNRLLHQILIQCLFLLIALILIFVYLLKYNDPYILNAFPSFQFGLIYLIASVHMGKDLMLVGLWMCLTAIISLYIQIPIQNIWLAFTVGGGLFITGIIFRYQVKRIRENNSNEV